MPLNIDIQQILLHMLNFVILFAVLYFVLYKPVKNFMDRRDEDFNEKNDRANRAMEEADSAKSAYEEKLSGIEDEIKSLREDARKKGVEEADAIREQARREADEILEDARRKAEQAKTAAVRSADNQIRAIAEQAAEKLVIESTAQAYENFIETVNRPAPEEEENGE
ncbi:MAG: ATP synthase F0 subunit B [Clostridia bacterium]|jgi:F-type H+-transporting ATPase subunit b|nr:ATP synthase F0 subunit B [Clostridia bacterium]